MICPRLSSGSKKHQLLKWLREWHDLKSSISLGLLEKGDVVQSKKRVHVLQHRSLKGNMCKQCEPGSICANSANLTHVFVVSPQFAPKNVPTNCLAPSIGMQLHIRSAFYDFPDLSAALLTCSKSFALLCTQDRSSIVKYKGTEIGISQPWHFSLHFAAEMWLCSKPNSVQAWPSTHQVQHWKSPRRLQLQFEIPQCGDAPAVQKTISQSKESAWITCIALRCAKLVASDLMLCRILSRIKMQRTSRSQWQSC